MRASHRPLAWVWTVALCALSVVAAGCYYSGCPPGGGQLQIYVTDQGNDRVVRMDAMNGSNWTTFGSAGSGTGQFDGPAGMDRSRGPGIVVADALNGRIVSMSTDMIGGYWFDHGAPGTGIDQFNGPVGVSIGHSALLPYFVADSGNDRIVRMDDGSGKNWTAFGSLGSGIDQFDGPVAVYENPAGKIFVVDAGNSRIVQMDDLSGTNWVTFGTLGSGSGQFDHPVGAYIDAAGRIYIADAGNGRIVRIDDISGTNWTTFGTFGPGAGQFNHPTSLVVDEDQQYGDGRIYVVDQGNNRVIRIDDMTGAHWAAFGTRGSGRLQFLLPYAISLGRTVVPC